jgi:hypothetical protein
MIDHQQDNIESSMPRMVGIEQTKYNRHLRNLVLNRAEGRDGFHKGAALFRVPDRVQKSSLAETNSRRSQFGLG